MAYSQIEQQTRDLDLFLRDDEKLVHIATAGGVLPDQLAENDINSEIFLTLLDGISPIFEVEINPLLSSILGIPQQNVELYLTDFIRMAERGFYSYDKSVLGDFEDTLFHLVARPTNNTSVSIPLVNENLLLKIDGKLPSDFNSFDLFKYFD